MQTKTNLKNCRYFSKKEPKMTIEAEVQLIIEDASVDIDVVTIDDDEGCRQLIDSVKKTPQKKQKPRALPGSPESPEQNFEDFYTSDTDDRVVKKPRFCDQVSPPEENCTQEMAKGKEIPGEFVDLNENIIECIELESETDQTSILEPEPETYHALEPEPEVLFTFNGPNPLLNDKILKLIFGQLNPTFNQVKLFRTVCKKWNNQLYSRIEDNVSKEGHLPIQLITHQQMVDFNMNFRGKKAIRMVFSSFSISSQFLQRGFLEGDKGHETRSFIRNFSTRVKQLTIVYPENGLIFPRILRGGNFPNLEVLNFDWNTLDMTNCDFKDTRKFLTPYSVSACEPKNQLSSLRKISFIKNSDVFASSEFYKQLAVLAPNLAQVEFPKFIPLDLNPLGILLGRSDQEVSKLSQMTLKNASTKILRKLLKYSENNMDFKLTSLQIICDPHVNWESEIIHQIVTHHKEWLEVFEICCPVIENTSVEVMTLDGSFGHMKSLRIPITSSIQFSGFAKILKQFPALEHLSNLHKSPGPICHCWNFESDVVAPHFWLQLPQELLTRDQIGLKSLEVGQPVPNTMVLELCERNLCPFLTKATFFIDTHNCNEVLGQLWTQWCDTLVDLTLVFVNSDRNQERNKFVINLDEAFTGIDSDILESPVQNIVFHEERTRPTICQLRKLEKLSLVRSFILSDISGHLCFGTMPNLKKVILNPGNPIKMLSEDCLKSLRLEKGIDIRVISSLEPDLILNFDPTNEAYKWLCMF